MSTTGLPELIIAIKGAGEMASAIAWRLFQARMRRMVMMEIPNPLAVRRAVSFCEAIHDGVMAVEGVEAQRVDGLGDIPRAWEEGRIAVIVDPRWAAVREMRPQVVVDAILAKRNPGTRMEEAPLVIALGPGFVAGQDAHLVIETNRGHNLGRLLISGSAEPDTGVPGDIGGYTAERVLRAPRAGTFETMREIGQRVAAGEKVGHVDGMAMKAGINGVLRGLIRSGTAVQAGLKLGDIDPRGEVDYCHTISDKARAIAGSVLEAILRVYNV
jgi:xanthine dehydrogenase accessory factor